MAQARLVKTLKRSTPTMVDKLSQFVFGDMSIDLYDPNRTYEIGDYVYTIDDNGVITFYECIEQTSGEFDPSKWKVVSVIGIMSSLVKISESEPSDPNLIMWYKPISYEFADVDKIVPEMNPTKLTHRTNEDGTAAVITGLHPLAPGESQHFYGAVKTPDKIDDLMVESIDNNAFSEVLGITDLVITDNIISIGEGAFMSNNESPFDSITIGYGIEVIPYKAFANQTAITYIDIPATVDKIEASAFDNCSGIVDVYVRGRNTVIATDAFSNCTALSTIHGVKNSTAQEFADAKGYAFVEI